MHKRAMLVKVGHVKDAHGIKGEIFVRILSGDTSWLEKLKVVNLKKDNVHLQYEPIRVRRHKEGIVFQFNEVVDRNHSETLKGYDFLIPEEFLKSQSGEAIYLSEILGFAVVDQSQNVLGTITSFASNGPQDLLVVMADSQEFLVPFVRDFVVEMRFTEKKIFMNLPPGLVEVAR